MDYQLATKASPATKTDRRDQYWKKARYVMQFHVTAERDVSAHMRESVSAASPTVRPRVPEAAPIALGEPMRIEPLPWKSWAENGVLLLTLSFARLAGR